jgi:hypothetical protein
MGISSKTKPVTSATPSPVPILIMKTATHYISPNSRPYNKLPHNGRGEIHLPTEAEATTVLQLIVLLAQELARLNKLQTGETGAAAPVIDYALRLMRQVEHPTQGEN